MSSAKATVNIKLLKPQSEESFRGENPHFENICISSSSFVLLLKAAFCTDHRGDASAQSTSAHVWPVTRALASYKQPDRSATAKSHTRTHTHRKRKKKTQQKQQDLIKPFQLSFFYCRRVNNRGVCAARFGAQSFNFSYDVMLQFTHSLRGSYQSTRTVCHICTTSIIFLTHLFALIQKYRGQMLFFFCF